MENLTEEQKQLIYDLYSLVVNARTIFQSYNLMFLKDVMEGDVRASQVILNNNVFLKASENMLSRAEIEAMEHDMQEQMGFLADFSEDDDREVN